MISWLAPAWDQVSSFIGPLTDVKVGVITAVIAYFAIVWPLRYQRSAALLDQAVRALERSFSALTADGATVSPVEADRLNWLTAARNIETYKALKRQIGVRVYRRIAEDHEEHWRNRFYLVLQHPAYHQPSYYSPSQNTLVQGRSSPIEPKSAIIVHAFAKWPKGLRDSVDHADFRQIFSETDPRPGNIGLRIYLQDSEIPGNAPFRNLPSPYPELSWCDRCLKFLGLQRRL